MPYIHQNTRIALSPAVTDLVHRINDLPVTDRDGAVHYVAAVLVTETLKPLTGWRYRDLQRVMGLFSAMGAEFYRRLVAPYESRCIQKNGDFYNYDET